MQHKAHLLGLWGGLISILIALVVLEPLAYGLYQGGKDGSFITLWAGTALALGGAAMYGARQTRRDPGLACLIQYLVGTFQLLFVMPCAIICLNAPAIIFFTISTLLAFASGNIGLRGSPARAEMANPFAPRPYRNL